MKNKHITLEYPDLGWTALFQLTDINRAAPACRACLDFFGDPVTREDDGDEAAINACLKMFGRTMIFHSMNGGVDHVRGRMAKEEGFFPLDGRNGLVLEECDSADFYDDSFVVEWPKQKTQE